MSKPSNVVLVFIDTCSLLVSCWDGDERRGEDIVLNPKKEKQFWDRELAALLNMGRVIVPLRNYEELQKHAKQRKKPVLARQSKLVLEKLYPLVASGRIEVIGDSNDPFADAILLSVALKFRTQHNLAFITQDTALAKDLTKIGSFESIQPREGQELKVRRISSKGVIEPWSARMLSARGISRVDESPAPAQSVTGKASAKKPVKPVKKNTQVQKLEALQKPLKSWWE